VAGIKSVTARCEGGPYTPYAETGVGVAIGAVFFLLARRVLIGPGTS
jgi:hypothetical protein